MPLYRFYLLNSQGRIFDPPYEVECVDDAAAKLRAFALTVDCSVEVWQSSRLVATLLASSSLGIVGKRAG